MFGVSPRDLFDWGARSQRVSLTPPMKEGEPFTLFESEGPGCITHLWFTFPGRDENLGRRNLLRMYWDGCEEPCVETPLTDFFGVPFGFTGNAREGQLLVNSRFVSIAEKNGFNCYFPMPFAKGARIEIVPEQIQSGGGFYFQADYYAFPEALPEAYGDFRFHAQYRFENPCENYGRNYLLLDAVGEGFLAGVTVGIKVNKPALDSWYHGGGDSIYIDGEGASAILHGIGAEDFFGHSWGVGPACFPNIGTSFGDAEKVAVYRWFADDPIPFRKSLRCVLGALGNEYTSVAYWYQKAPHRRYFDVPKADLRMPGAEAPYGTYDLEPADAEEWMLYAPYPLDAEHPFDYAWPIEETETGEESHVFDAGGKPTVEHGNQFEVQWRPQRAYHHFVDFHVVARPSIRCISTLANVVGYAVRYVESDSDQDVRIVVGFDDEIAVRVNNEEVFRAEHAQGYAQTKFTAHMRRGRNRICVKLSNQHNTTWKCWAFCFRIEDA